MREHREAKVTNSSESLLSSNSAHDRQRRSTGTERAISQKEINRERKAETIKQVVAQTTRSVKNVAAYRLPAKAEEKDGEAMQAMRSRKEGKKAKVDGV